MKLRTMMPAVLAIGLWGATDTARASVILASNYAASPSYSSYFIGVGFAGTTANGVFTNEAAAQEFTAQASGEISTIVASVDQFNPGGVPLTVTVFESSGSVPGTVLGSATFDPSEVSTNVYSQPSTFDLSAANITLTAGQNYFVTFTVATPISGSIRYLAMLLNDPNPIGFGFRPLYSRDGGTTWELEPVPNEIGLTINGKAAVPEPASMVMALTGLAALGFLRARRRRPAA